MANEEEKKTGGEKNNRARKEEEILAFWKERGIFEKTLEKESPKGEFVFCEGPPTANGKPGIHHIEARAFKDVIPRYKTMQGYHVRRKAGWDTHGLPVELQVEKELGLSSKKDIERFGIAAFNEKCKESIWKYRQEWEKFTERIAFWVDQKHPYVTYEPSYIESVWFLLAEAERKGLLYKDYKVVPWCPRCGTALSSHELAQGYETVKDVSVYVKFRAQNPTAFGLPEDSYFLAWTTTPWTLPGNVALAVGEDIGYDIVSLNGEHMVIASALREKVIPEGRAVRSVSGKELVGITYEPLYPFLKQAVSESELPRIPNAYKVYSADFVSTEDGTGIVHTAVMYGADDFALGTRVGLPKCHLINDAGEFISETDFLAGKKTSAVAGDIIRDLHEKGLLYKKETIEHSYPHCWRCKTALIYFARDSWYIRMSLLRDELVAENKNIHWEPQHIRDGRFGEWLRDIKDWAISRERYWGTPLPFWIEKTSGVLHVIDSIAALKERTKKSGNTYFIMRHGEAESNVTGIFSAQKDNPHHLTATGKREVERMADKFCRESIDYIVVSPFVRTRETAAIVAERLGLSADRLIIDERLGEFNVGDFDGKPLSADDNFFASPLDRFETSYPNGENLSDVKKRVGGALYDLENTYQSQKILIISHSTPLWMLSAASAGRTPAEALKLYDKDDGGFMAPAEMRLLPFVPLPHNEQYELDLHRPYIDAVMLEDVDGHALVRVSEVLDVWFDSGAVPFAQDHYPFENKAWVDGAGYPADYIAEAIDQTRGWFYTLHAVGVFLGRGKAYRNVICLGHILDAKGKKMSKSVGNVVDPWEMIERFGVDTLRFWMYAINQPGESKNFDEKTVADIERKVFDLFLNVLEFYTLYAPANVPPSFASSHILDAWISARTRALAARAAEYLDRFHVLEPAREIRDFIADLSQWYLRRSRGRFKGEDVEDRKRVAGTMRAVLLTLAKIMAPFTPFVSEQCFQALREENDSESVHLASWPVYAKTEKDSEIITTMDALRTLVSSGLEARAQEGIKVRQPLAQVTFQSPNGETPLWWNEEAHALVADELNVKRVLFAPQERAAVLDTALTEALKGEGTARELIRYIQDLRKQNNLSPRDRIRVAYRTNTEGERIIHLFEETIRKGASVETLQCDTGGPARVPHYILIHNIQFFVWII